MEELKNNEDTNIKNENDYLEMTNHLKSIYDIKEKELSNVKEDNLDFKKVIMSCYGCIRLLDQNYHNILLDDSCNQLIIESLRSYLSDVVEYKILKLEEEL
jgi:hypothetical protein|tara:strand:- start:2420 stop:2722 length:303 start_codon:yes stop_codon:yes gene_type:complete